MEPLELDLALEELELRLERLRSLYEQYFIGIEKLEPSIPRKDVDRRIFVLRRERIRNTGKRFKLQTLIQRYNTFQQYWQRICREIENGTYKRHVLRAERTIGPTNLMTVAARRRFGKEREIAQNSLPPEARTPSGRPGQSTLPRRPTTVPPSSSRARTPTLSGLQTTPPGPASVGSSPSSRPASRQPPAPRAAASRPDAARPATTASTRQGRHDTPPFGSQPPPPATSFESLELDMDFMGDWDPQTTPAGTSAIGASAARGGQFRSPKAQQPNSPRRPVPSAPRNDEIPAPLPPTPAVSRPRLAPPPKPGRPAPVLAPEPRAAAVALPEAGPPDEQTVRIAATRAAAAARPPRSSATPPAGTPSVRPVMPESAPREPAIESPRIPASPRVPTQARSVPQRPAIANGPRAPIEPRPLPTAKVSDKKPTAESSVTEARLRELHTRLQEANKQAGQKSVSLDGLAKSLRAAEAKLRTQHGNRRIEFEVVLKEGKPVVKPVVR